MKYAWEFILDRDVITYLSDYLSVKEYNDLDELFADMKT